MKENTDVSEAGHEVPVEELHFSTVKIRPRGGSFDIWLDGKPLLTKGVTIELGRDQTPVVRIGIPTHDLDVRL